MDPDKQPETKRVIAIATQSGDRNAEDHASIFVEAHRVRWAKVTL